MVPRLVLLQVIVGVAVLVRPGEAQPRRDPVAAEALFQQGKESWAKGRWQEACARFEASMELEPSVSVALKIARCREREGKLAQAWYQVQRAAALNLDTHRDRPARREELARVAREALADLEPRVPRLTVALPSPPAGVLVLRDGVALPLASLGEALPVDPGLHEIVASAPGFSGVRVEVALREGEARSVTLALDPAPPALSSSAPAASSSAPVALATTSTPAPAPSPSSVAPRGRSVRRGVGMAAGAVGLGALGVAGYLGVETLRLLKRSAPECTRDNACTQEGLALRGDASRAQSWGFVSLGVGLGLVGVGVALLLPGSTPAASARLVVAPGNVAVEGAW